MSLLSIFYFLSTGNSTDADTFPISGFENLVPDATFLEKLKYGLKICGIGMLVVFLVLLTLNLILHLFKLFNKRGEKTPSTDAVTPDVKMPTVGEVRVGDVIPAVSGNEAAGGSNVLAAVIGSAIAAHKGEKDISFNIVSIKELK